MKLKLEIWVWGQPSAFRFPFPPSGFGALATGHSGAVHDAVDDMLDWIGFRIKEGLLYQDTFRYADPNSVQPREIHVFIPENGAASLGVFWDSPAGKLHLMGLWLKGQTSDVAFVQAARTELGI